MKWHDMVAHPLAGPVLRRILVALLGAGLGLLGDAALLDAQLVASLQHVLYG